MRNPAVGAVPLWQVTQYFFANAFVSAVRSVTAFVVPDLAFLGFEVCARGIEPAMNNRLAGIRADNERSSLRGGSEEAIRLKIIFGSLSDIAFETIGMLQGFGSNALQSF